MPVCERVCERLVTVECSAAFRVLPQQLLAQTVTEIETGSAFISLSGPLKSQSDLPHRGRWGVERERKEGRKSDEKRCEGIFGSVHLYNKPELSGGIQSKKEELSFVVKC